MQIINFTKFHILIFENNKVIDEQIQGNFYNFRNMKLSNCLCALALALVSALLKFIISISLQINKINFFKLNFIINVNYKYTKN